MLAKVARLSVLDIPRSNCHNANLTFPYDNKQDNFGKKGAYRNLRNNLEGL